MFVLKSKFLKREKQLLGLIDDYDCFLASYVKEFDVLNKENELLKQSIADSVKDYHELQLKLEEERDNCTKIVMDLMGTYESCIKDEEEKRKNVENKICYLQNQVKELELLVSKLCK